MTKNINVTCDHCQRDITYANNCNTYRISLSNESMLIHPCTNPEITMAFYPHLSHNMNFCNMDCLKSWVTKEIMNKIFDSLPTFKAGDIVKIKTDPAE